MAYTYSKCSAEGVRFLAHYYTTPCRLGFPLPPNVPNLPCSVNCGSGSYLQPGASACRFAHPPPITPALTPIAPALTPIAPALTLRPFL